MVCDISKYCTYFGLFPSCIVCYVAEAGSASILTCKLIWWTLRNS